MSLINQNQINTSQNQQFSQSQIQHISNRNFPQIQYNQNEQQQNLPNYKEEDIINQIRNFIDKNNINELYKFININQPSKQALQSCLSYLLDNYHQKNPFSIKL